MDLGSNSFHLVVARREHGELRFLDRIREMVRLAGGLGADGSMDHAVQGRALECLARFGQRLRGIPNENIRAVGTQTFRRMRNANAFLLVAETALGCPVDIIGGREEARLIYIGVSQGVPGHDSRRLVIDIGGGSTELVIGDGPTPLEMESLQFGCVSGTHWHFADGRVARPAWDRARRAVLAELQELQTRYRDIGWDTAFGSSGTIRAAAAICAARGWCEDGITHSALEKLQEEVLRRGHVGALKLPGLSERRRAVFPGGLVMLVSCFQALEIEAMKVSPFALREGVLHDLLGRLEHRDPRDKTVQAFKSRYGVDADQASRVRGTALEALAQMSGRDAVEGAQGEMLGWAADLHETGLGISHSMYQRHSGYLVQESDMAGFSQQEQLFLATLVRHHRRAIPAGYDADLPARLHPPLRKLMVCLRLACILCRTREDRAIPEFRVEAIQERLSLHLDPGWAMAHPLTIADLEQERDQVRSIGLDLEIILGPGGAARG